MAYKDLREYIKPLERDRELKRIAVPVKGTRDDNELDALRFYAGMSNRPALLPENFKGLDTPGVPLLLTKVGSGVLTWEKYARFATHKRGKYSASRVD